MLPRRSALSTFLFVFLFLGLACSASASNPIVWVQIQNPDGSHSPRVRAEVVSTDATRTLGLMYRKSLAESEGMLFLFPKERELSFWMRNTYIELDIIFIDSNWKVVSIVERAVPLSETLRKSAAPAQFALEVRGGLARSWNIQKGSKVQVEGKLPEPK